jgi:hypothetical protein
MAPDPQAKALNADPIFIVGAARSGTTWVYDLLTSHPLVGGVYETWLFTRENGLGSLFTQAHWPPQRSGLSSLIERSELIEEVRRFSLRLMTRNLERGQTYLVEKSPSHVYSIPLIHEIFPGARIIHVLRDGRDVAVSVRAAANSWVPQWKESFGRSVYSSGRAWKHAVQRARLDGSALAEDFIELRYEDLKRDPEGSIASLFAHCGIQLTRAQLEFALEKTDFAANFRPKESGFRRGGRVGDWKSRFSLLDALRFNLAAGDALVQMQYERNRFWLPAICARQEG